MKIKKMIIGVFCAAGIPAFAQNAEYNALLAKAKEYESKKLYASAMGTYWDAVAADMSQKGGEAEQNYEKLGKLIADGKPGYGDFDEFSLYDDWVALLKDFERYWTENLPVGVLFGDIEKGAIDRESRTATYYVYADYGYTAKVYDMCSFIRKGLKQVRRSDWDGVSEYWPHISVYQNVVEKDGKYFRDETALFKAPHDWGTFTKWNVSGQIAPAAFGMGIIWTNNSHYNGKLLYEYHIALTDENGTILAQNTSRDRKDDSWSNGSGYYEIFEFAGIKPDVMKILDAGKTKIMITKVLLKYGKTTTNNADYLEEEWKKLPTKDYDANKVVRKENDIYVMD